ncbi:glycosyltransferase family 2 protein [bacterium]|nr:glycosyltransferase family 2 protein [candidate division CSSED10-310 bacterium]
MSNGGVPVDLTIAIVNFNTDILLRECLSSIEEHCGRLSIEAIVVDNASTDGSADCVPLFPWARLVVNRDNVGFAMANNQALRQARGRLILLLNPDTLVLPGMLPSMSTLLDSRQEFGAICPRTYLDKERRLEVCSLKIPTPANSLLLHTPLWRWLPRNKELERIWRLDMELWRVNSGTYDVDGIGGACFMLRREVMDRIGPLDERFYMGYEDTDWSLKVRRLGLRVAILTDAELIHYFGQSKRKVAAAELPIAKWRKGLLPFLRVHYSPWRTGGFVIARSLADMGGALRRLWPNGTLMAAGEEPETVRLTWESGDDGNWLLEISNSPVFFDKFGVRVHGRDFEINRDVRRRLASGAYWWRLYPRDGYDLRHPRSSGIFHIS